MNTQEFWQHYHAITEAGYGEEIVWQESLPPCKDVLEFYRQYRWVVISSGMKNQVASLIEERIDKAMFRGDHISTAFRHHGKCEAIIGGWEQRHERFWAYLNAEDKVEYLESLPWIGSITKWHLAKNLGLDVAKPDRHLVRVAEKAGMSVAALCQQLSGATGLRVATVDYVIWRACNLGLVKLS